MNEADRRLASEVVDVLSGRTDAMQVSEYTYTAWHLIAWLEGILAQSASDASVIPTEPVFAELAHDNLFTELSDAISGALAPCGAYHRADPDIIPDAVTVGFLYGLATAYPDALVEFVISNILDAMRIEFYDTIWEAYPDAETFPIADEGFDRIADSALGSAILAATSAALSRARAEWDEAALTAQQVDTELRYFGL